MLRGLRRADAVVVGVEGDRDERRQDDPRAENGFEGPVEVLEEVRRHGRDETESDRDGDDEEVVAVAAIDASQDAHAGRRDHAEHHNSRAAKDLDRNRGDQRRKLRNDAEDHQDRAASDIGRPHARHTHEADVVGKRSIGERVEDPADDRQPCAVPRPSRRRSA